MDSSQGNNNKLPSNLPQLQNLIKRDPVSYAEEFERQHSVYSATLLIFEQNPSLYNEQLHELIMFLAQVAQCYPKELNELPQELMTILKRHASVLHPEMRMTFVKALVLLRNKNLLSPTDLHILFFQLLQCQDKSLRKFLQQHVITDIKNLNNKSKNMKLNRELQNFMYEMLKAKHAVAAKTSLNVMIELYNKKVWNDAKTVNIITTACFHKVTKIMVAAMRFFVGRDDEDEENEKKNDSDSSDDEENQEAALKATVMAYRVNKKTKKRKQKKLEKVKTIVKKKSKDKNTKLNIDFSALHLIHDPQDMADRLYKKLEKMNERFEVKLMTMNLISRLMGIHKLYLPNFYAMVQRYLNPHQREVTKVMVYAAQAAHDEVPPDDIEPLVRALANNFVTDRYSNEVIAMGLNTIRELCARNPYGMTEELMEDLAQYKTHKDKGVSMAARSLIVLYREKNPELLTRKNRTAPTELKAEEGQKDFGESKAQGHIPGAEILAFTAAEECDSDEDIDMDNPELYIASSDDEDDGDDDDEGKDDDDNKNNNPSLSTKDAVKEVMKLTAEERAEKAQDIATTRFFTDQDYAKIAALQAAKYVERFSLSRKTKNSKRKLEIIEDKTETGELVPLKNIEMIYKKRKHDKQTRMASVASGRVDRDKFGKKRPKLNPHASTTNKQKTRGKNFMMMKHKVKSKQKQSFRDKQMKLRKALLKQKKYK